MSDEKGDFPLKTRTTVILNVSTIGTKTMLMPMMGEFDSGIFSMKVIISAETERPHTRDPASPINMLAFFILYLRNPHKEPASADPNKIMGFSML